MPWFQRVTCLLILSSCQTLPFNSSHKANWTFIPAPEILGHVAHSSCAAADGKLVIFGGIEEGADSLFNNRMALYDPVTNRWEIPDPEQGPSPRNFAAFAAFDHSIFVLGGETPQQSAQADAYAYDLRSGSWHRGENGFTPRKQATLTAVGSQLVLMGGKGPAPVTNWGHYDGETRQWHATPLLEGMSSRVSSIAIALDAYRLMIWGGFAGQQRMGDGFILDVKSKRVEPLPPTQFLSPRANARAVRLGDKVLIWGGSPEHGSSNSGAIFSIHTQQWEALPPIPDARFHQLKGAEIAVWGQSGIILIGGRFGADAFNEQVWWLDIKTRQWARLESAEGPAARTAHCLVSLSPQELAVFGGIGYKEGSQTLTHLGGIWLLRFSSEDQDRVTNEVQASFIPADKMNELREDIHDSRPQRS